MCRSPACAHCGATNASDTCSVCASSVCAACLRDVPRRLVVESVSATVCATYGFGLNDDRVFLDDELQLYAVADASGPTYGGHHKPTGVEPGWLAMCTAWRSAPSDNPRRMRDVLAAANTAMFDPRWPAGGLTHPTASFTVLGFHHGHVAVGQVGTCRAYRARGSSLELLVDDHSLGTQCQRSGEPVPEYHRDVATHLLGAGVDVEGVYRTEAVRSGDIFLLCTDGLWTAVPDDQLRADNPAAMLRRLPQEHHGDATAVLLRAG